MVAALAPPSAIPTIPDQTVAQLGDATFGNAEVDRPGLDHEDLITVVEPAPTPAASPTDVPWPLVAALAPPSAIPAIPEQTVAQLRDSTFGNAEVCGPDLDLEHLITAVEAAPTPAASPTDVPRPSVAALAPLSAIPAISESTVAQLGNSTFGNAEIREPGLTHEDLIAAVEAARDWTAPEDAWRRWQSAPPQRRARARA